MVSKYKSFAVFLTCGVLLTGCDTTTPKNSFNFKTPLSSLNANKTVSPVIVHVVRLMEKEKYKDASLVVNQALQKETRSSILHTFNGLLYEKLAEGGDPAGLELAAVGYQNAITLNPSNVFAISQLGKIAYKEKNYEKAQEQFANALLISPDDPNLWHELAAASYYSYDLRTALAAITKASKLNPKDPLISRSATMIYASIGDFKTAQKYFDHFKAEVGNDKAAIHHVQARLNDWNSLYKSGRFRSVAATKEEVELKDPSPSVTTSPLKDDSPSSTGTSSSSSSAGTASSSTGTSASSTSGTTSAQKVEPTALNNTAQTQMGATTTASSSSGGGGDVPSGGGGDVPSGGSGGDTPSGGGGGGDDSDGTGTDGTSTDGTSTGTTATDGASAAGSTGGDATEPSTGTSAVAQPAASSGSTGLNGKKPEDSQVIVDCYLLRVTEDAETVKGHNILENLAVTFNPGGFTRFFGNFSGSGVATNKQIASGASSGTPTNVNYTADSGFRPNQGVAQGGGFAPAYTPAIPAYALGSSGSFSGRIFTAGVTWAGLTYNLNIANAITSRTRVVSRPSLSTFLNKKTSFFAGDELVAGFTGQFGGSLVKYQIGVTIDVTPTKIEGDMVTLDISLQGSLINAPNLDLSQTVVVGKANISTSIKMRLGETFLLGGLYESIEVDLQSGFPGLSKVPLLQYFFAQEATSNSRRTVMAMITPRSPDSVRDAINRAVQRGEIRPHIKELETRNYDWFSPWPNMVAVVNSFGHDPALYFEFRTGDVLPPHWGWEPSFNNKLLEMSRFLYF